MTYTPKGLRWYLAELIQEVNLEPTLQSIVHVKTVLVRADTPEIAYKKALELGKESETSYENVHGQLITLIFQGLRDLKLIYDDELAHGAELIFEEMMEVTPEQMKQMISPKETLSVFLPANAMGSLTYMPKDVMVDLVNYFEKECPP